MKVDLANRGEFSLIEEKLHNAVDNYLQSDVLKDFSVEKSTVLRERLGVMKENVLRCLKNNVTCAGVEWEDPRTSAPEDAGPSGARELSTLELPQPIVPPTDQECEELESRVQLLAERVAKRRVEVLPLLSQQMAAELDTLQSLPEEVAKEHMEGARTAQEAECAALEEGGETQTTRDNTDSDPSKLPTTPEYRALQSQLASTVHQLPPLINCLKASIQKSEDILSALEASKKRPADCSIEQAIHSGTPTGDGTSPVEIAMSSGKIATRKRLARDLQPVAYPEL